MIVTSQAAVGDIVSLVAVAMPSLSVDCSSWAGARRAKRLPHATRRFQQRSPIPYISLNDYRIVWDALTGEGTPPQRPGRRADDTFITPPLSRVDGDGVSGCVPGGP